MRGSALPRGVNRRAVPVTRYFSFVTLVLVCMYVCARWHLSSGLYTCEKVKNTLDVWCNAGCAENQRGMPKRVYWRWLHCSDEFKGCSVNDGAWVILGSRSPLLRFTFVPIHENCQAYNTAMGGLELYSRIFSSLSR